MNTPNNISPLSQKPQKPIKNKYLFQEISLKNVVFDERINISGKKTKSINIEIRYPKVSRMTGVGFREIDMSAKDVLIEDVQDTITLPLDFKYNLATGTTIITKKKGELLYAPPVLYEKNLLFTLEDISFAKKLEDIMTAAKAESLLVFPGAAQTTTSGVNVIYGIVDPLKNKKLNIVWAPSQKQNKKNESPLPTEETVIHEEVYTQIAKKIEQEAIMGKLFNFFYDNQTSEEKMEEDGLKTTFKQVSYMLQKGEVIYLDAFAEKIFKRIFFNKDDLFQTEEKRVEFEESRKAFAQAFDSESPLKETDRVLKLHSFVEGFKKEITTKGLKGKKGIIVDFMQPKVDIVGEALKAQEVSYFSLYGKSENGFSVKEKKEDLNEDEKRLFMQGFNFFSRDVVFGFSEKHNKLRAITKSNVIMDAKYALALAKDNQKINQSEGNSYVYIGKIGDIEEELKMVEYVDNILNTVQFKEGNSYSSIVPEVINGNLFLIVDKDSFGIRDKREIYPDLGRAIVSIAKEYMELNTLEFLEKIDKFKKMADSEILERFPEISEDEAKRLKNQLVYSEKTLLRSLENHYNVTARVLSSRRPENDFVPTHISSKVNETIVTQRQILKAQKIIEKVKLEDVFRTLTTLSEKEKVFPNLQYIKASKVSLKTITESPVMAIQYTRFKSIAPIIKNAMLGKGLTPPSTPAHEFDLVNKKNNVLPDHLKDIEIDATEKNGIVNLKNFPALIKTNSDEAVKEFIDTAIQSILKTFNPKDEDYEMMYNAIESEFKEQWLEKLKKSHYAILKSESYMEGTDLIKKEKYVLIDESLNELEDAVVNVPIFEFSKVLEEKKILNKEDRVKSAVFREKDIHNVFDAMVSNIASGFKDEPVIFNIIKNNFSKFFTSANERSKNGVFKPVTEEYISIYLDEKRSKEELDTLAKLKELNIIDKIKNGLKESKDVEEVVNSSFDVALNGKAISANIIILKQKTIDIFRGINTGQNLNKENTITQNDSFSKKLKETGLSQAIMKFLSEKMLTSSEISRKVFKSVYDGPMDFKKINMQEDLKQFIEDTFIGKEHHYYKNDDMNILTKHTLQTSIFKDCNESKELVEEYLNIVAEESVKDFNIQDSALSLINGAAFMDFMIRQKKKTKDGQLSSEQKTDLLKVALTKVFRLRPHQAKLTMGLLALYLSGKITVSNVWWLMRTGKTATTLVTLLLTAWTTRSNSAFFIQKKNFVDILGQMFRIWPFALAHNTTALGPNRKYNITEAKAPLVITEWVYKNIPVALRDKLGKDGKSLLKNPIQGSDLSPVEAIGETFGKNMELFIKVSKEINDTEFKKITRKNKKLLDYEFCMGETEVPDTEAGRVLSKAFYFYIVKIIRDKFLPEAIEGSISGEVVKKMYNSHWEDYRNEAKLKKRTSGGLVLIGKQFISGFDTSEEISNIYKISGKGNPPTIITDYDVSFSTKEENNTDKILEKMDIFIDGLEVPGFSGEEALLPSLLTSSTESGNKKRKIQNEATAKSISSMLLDIESARITKIVEDLPQEDFSEDEEFELYDDLETLQESIVEIFTRWTGFSFPVTPKNTTLSYILADNIPAEGLLIDLSYKIEDLEKLTGMLKNKSRPQVLQNIFQQIAKEYTTKKDLAKIISNSVYKCVAISTIDNNILGNQTSIKRRIGLFSGVASPKSVSFMYNLSSPTNLIVPIKQKALTKKEIADGVKREITINEILTNSEISKKEDPSITKDEKLYPKQAFLVVNNSGEYYIKYEELFYKDKNINIRFEEKFKKFNSNYTSPTMWYFGEKTSIIGIGIDEVHKTIKNPAAQKLGIAGGVCHHPDYKNLKIFITYLTGTPYTGNLSVFSNLITTQASDKMSKLLSKEIRKHNGNFKITDQVMAFMIDKNNHSPQLEKIFHETLIEAFKKILEEGSKTNISEIVENMRNELISDPKVFSDMMKFSEENDFESIPSSAEMIKSFSIIIKDVIKILSREFKNKVNELKKIEEYDYRTKNRKTPPPEEKINISNRATEKALKTFDVSLLNIEETIIEGRTILSRPAPGLSNLVAMAAVVGYSESNISIKALTDKMQYITLDSNDGEFDRKTKPNLAIDEEIILNFEDIIAKYRRRFALTATYQAFRKLLEIATDGVKEHGSVLLGLTSIEVNELINKTKSSKSDGILDILKDSIVYEKSIPSEKEAVIEVLINIVNFIADNEQEKIKNLARTLEDGESGYINITDNHKIKVSVEELTSLVFSFNMANNRHNIASYEKAVKEDVKSSNQHYLALKKNGIFMIGKDKNGKVNGMRRVAYMTSLETQPFKELPPIKSKINITYNDEASLINVGAGIVKIKDKLLEHINKDENTRTMTTRTDMTKYGLEATLQALIERDDISKTHTILLNETSDEVTKFRKEIEDNPELVKLLKAKNILIESVSVEDLEVCVDPILSQGGKLHFIGNIASSAEGVNNDYIQVGMFLGPLNEDPNITTQSVARQTGNNQDESLFYFYGGGGVYHKLTKSEQHPNPIMFLDSIEKGLSVKVHNQENITSNRNRFIFKGAITQGKTNSTTPAIVKANKKAEINLNSANTFITGNPDMFDLSKISEEELSEYLKNFIIPGKSGEKKIPGENTTHKAETKREKGIVVLNDPNVSQDAKLRHAIDICRREYQEELAFIASTKPSRRTSATKKK